MKMLVVLPCFSILLAGSCNPVDKEVPEKPNVLMICVDDLNDWLGCMGGHPNAKTPNIDRLAAGGVLFRNAHCQAPLCGPSRASLMSGLRPSTTGIYGQINDNDIRRENPATSDVLFLPEYFRRGGYHTMGVGKIFHGHAPDGVFDESGGREPGFGPLPPERFVWSGEANKEGYGGTSTDWGAFPAEDSLMPDYLSTRWTIERLEREHDKPFFLVVGFLRPHVPWYVPQKWYDLHPLESIKTPPYLEEDLDDIPAIALAMDDLPMMPSTRWAIDSGEWPKIVQSYLACVSFVDFYIGEILKALEESRYAENTIIVFWSDHGYRLGEKHTFAKHCLWEEATNAPLIFTGPAIGKGSVVSAPVEMLSIYPTLLELCKLPPYERNEGVSLAPVLWGQAESTQDYALTTYGWRNHAVRTGTSRYIRYQDGSEEFYDHRTDPNEWHNLAGTDAQGLEGFEAYLPAQNAPYARHSEYQYNPFFTQDKLNHSR